MMANTSQLNSILSDVEDWNQWRLENPSIEIQLNRANLNRAKLIHVNLTQANLHQAKLRKADLAQAKLNHADLSHATLNQTNLQGSDLRRGNLIKAEVIRSNLSQTDLRRADLRRANFSNANFSQAILNGANLRGSELGGSDLSGAKLIRANLMGANLTGANLTGANLTGANLTGTNLTGANLTGATLINSKLSGVLWTETNLDKAKFQNNLGLSHEKQKAMTKCGAIFLVEGLSGQGALEQLYHLLIIADSKGTRTIPLCHDSYTIGRDAQAEIRLHDPNVSRSHAVLKRLYDSHQKSFYSLTDGDLDGNRSRNGIKVNNIMCRSQLLETGDSITLGKTMMEYRIEKINPEDLEIQLQDMTQLV